MAVATRNTVMRKGSSSFRHMDLSQRVPLIHTSSNSLLLVSAKSSKLGRDDDGNDTDGACGDSAHDSPTSKTWVTQSVCENTGGVGNDPREDRYFSIPKQARLSSQRGQPPPYWWNSQLALDFVAQNYDPEGEYVAFWLPELQVLPNDKRNFPGQLYMKPIVALRFGNHYKVVSSSARRIKPGGKQTERSYR
ncbi:unnamed protein product [Ilex paraguariensis]|uniref:Uncharacterized protein n=1 Tax=Ilex paraguariensis TaxID=185542 RepID=A0ABC8T291_9AQUA